MSDKVTVVSPVASVRFPNLTDHEVFSGVSTGKYSLTMIFKPEDKKELEDAIKKAGGGKGKSPLKEIGKDEQYDPGMLLIKAKTAYSVKAVDASGAIVPLDSITHGADVRAKLTFVPYTMSGGGTTCYLGNIQLLSSGNSGDLDFGELPSGYEPGEDELNDPLPF